MITYNFRLGFFYYFIPHIFQLRKFFSNWLKSLKWIQLLCDYINSPRVVLFCHKVGFGFTLPTMKSIESLSIVLRKYILYLLSKKIVTIFSTDWVTTTLQRITLWASIGYSFFGQSHIKMYSLDTSNSKLSNNYFVITLIYISQIAQNTFFFSFF